ncbi:hypothetical protein pdam_00004501 [Pocillopora damicornis]|uniref:Sodium-dependent multivitamin transporter n=2 Tax=Pocillopora damicornis TaxID=46731 RepID=A0A3M6V2E2_POCDA|nr:hypothetical protein pdam_00004501 [Pocillopora damicornis]
MADERFGIVDYVVFSVMMLISALIGIWYGCGPGGKQKTTAEYLLGDRQMKNWPVAISLLVSYLSAITLLGVPSEIYTYGAQYYVLIISYFIICFTVAVIFVPMFRRVNITCANEYLELRFSVGVRMVGCVFFILEYTLYLFVVLYAPSLALEAVAGIPLTASILTTGVVCTFYTSLGGLKAVVWTDVFQSAVMVGGLITVAVIGSVEVGGLAKVWEINEHFNRTTFFDFNPDPKVRNTFWTLTIGGAFTAMPVWTVSQTAVQRFLAIRTLKDAKRAVWMNVPGLIVIVTLCCLDGLVIFAVYSGCDLIKDKKITSNDQTLPYFVINKLHNLKGLPGMFTACLYAGALSTGSSALNAMSLVILEDIIKKRMKNLTDSDAARLCKIIAVVFGVIVIAGAFIVKYVGTMVLQLAYSIFGICGGPLLGIFLLGMFVRRANSKGAYAGVFSGCALTAWVFLGSVFYPPNKYPGTTSVRECQFYKDAVYYTSLDHNATTSLNVTAEILNKSQAILDQYGDGYIYNPHKPHGLTIDHWKKLQKTDTAECIKNVTADTVFWMMKSLKITKHIMAEDHFSVVDYVVFSIMLLISALIGIWYGCGPGGNKQRTTAEYLLGDRQMKNWPVAISILVSFLSAITLLGLPAEIYTYGTQFYLIIISYVLICIPVGAVYIPMFRRIKITSVNEYLDMRFSFGARMLGCAFFLLSVTLYLFVALFAPSLALEAVAGIPLSVSIVATGVVCTFYTSLGGLKAVVWTDVFQSIIMLAGLITVAVSGSLEVGGLSKVWEINKKHGRINFSDFNPDPRIRNTFWTLTMGGTIALLPVWATTQYFVQRYLAVRTLKEAKRALWLNIPGLIIVVTICTLDGMVIFATYADCDLRETKKISRGDQVLPYFVINKLGHLKGLPGMFTACLYGAALSTISSALNAMSLVTVEDLIKRRINLTDSEATKISKVMAVFYGGIVMGGAFAVKYTGAMVLQLAYSITGIFGGALLAVVTLGMFVPRMNSKGVYFGVLTGVALSAWVFVGSVFYPPDTNPGLRSVEGCSFYQQALINDTQGILSKYDNGTIRNRFKPHTGTPLADLYSLSYFWISGVSFGAAFIVGLIASFAFETEADRRKKVDSKLLFPTKAWLRGFLPGHKFTWEEEEMAYLSQGNEVQNKKQENDLLKNEDTKL